MANLNRIILVGKLTADPEARTTMDGIPMAKFRLAVDRQPQSGTDFFDVVAWRRAAEVAGDRLKRGSLVLVEGRIQIRSFEDQSGKRRWATEVVARSVSMLEGSRGPRPLAAQAEAIGPDTPEGSPDEEFVDDAGLGGDLPF